MMAVMMEAMKKKNEWKYKIEDRFHVRDMYQVQNNENLKRLPNAVYFNAKNTEEHELHKAVAGLTLNKYGIILESENLKSAITMLAEVIRMQAERIKEPPKWFITEAQQRAGFFGLKAPGKRRDLVILDDHTPVEWEKDRKRSLRHEDGVRMIPIYSEKD